MTLLNQIVAARDGIKSRTTRDVTDLHRLTTSAPELFMGIARKYTPRDDEGDRLPDESKLVQLQVTDVLSKVQESMTALFDVVLTAESANRDAAADVVVDGQTVLTAVPVTYLLFLEKQLTDIGTFVEKLPILDPAAEWRVDANTGAFVTGPVYTTRSTKVRKNWVKAEATKEHPAQVEVFHEDEIVGTWETYRFSGAIPAQRKDVLLARVRALQTAVKFAREEANTLEITQYHAGASVFGWLFG